jgi:uncharacterized heparinase superfamily protein
LNAAILLRRTLLYVRTARRLRWRQWAYRPLRRVQAHLSCPAPRRTEPTHRRRAECMASVWRTLDAPAGGPERPSADAARAGTFSFAGVTKPLADIDWTGRYISPLWTYHLQYFDVGTHLALAARTTGDPGYAGTFRQLVEGWIAGAPTGLGPGWEPYPLSLRTANWMRARTLFGDLLDPGFRARLDASLFAQLYMLERRLEWHILANHLQKNLHALVLGGLLFDGPVAARWRRWALPLLWGELFEQVLPDGGHFERSPMYHGIALGDFLELLALLDACGEPVPEAVRTRVRGMAEAWSRLSREDGTPHLFNDAAEEIAPPRHRLASLAALALGELPVPAPGPWSLPDTGYHGWKNGSGDRLIVDCGPPGPGYQPGHAHCDVLSFELDLGGRPVIVDAGVSGYDGDPLREYARSTRAHNTVMIAGREQSEVWGTFRVGRMAEAGPATSRVLDGAFLFEGSCRPYHARRTAHRRTIGGADGDWRVTDRVEGADGAPLAGFLHLHPDFEVRVEQGAFVARAPGTTVWIEPFGADRVRVAAGERSPAQGWYCPQFGTALPAAALEMKVERNDGREFGYRIRRLDR